MSARGKFVLAIVGVLVVALAFFFFFIRPQQQELTRVEDEVVAEEARTNDLRAELARLQDLKENAPQLEADLARIRELVPSNDQVPNFIFQTQQAANESGVGFVQITPELPKPPPEGSALAEVRTTISARGGYFAVQDFIRRLYRLDRALRIDLLKISGTEDEVEAAARGRTTLQIVARIFFEAPAGANSGVAPGTTPTTPAPAGSPGAPSTGTPPSET